MAKVVVGVGGRQSSDDKNNKLFTSFKNNIIKQVNNCFKDNHFKAKTATKKKKNFLSHKFEKKHSFKKKFKM